MQCPLRATCCFWVLQRKTTHRSRFPAILWDVFSLCCCLPTSWPPFFQPPVPVSNTRPFNRCLWEFRERYTVTPRAVPAPHSRASKKSEPLERGCPRVFSGSKRDFTPSAAISRCVCDEGTGKHVPFRQRPAKAIGICAMHGSCRCAQYRYGRISP